ncbi:alpha/beta fold hydrolase [Catenulispora pinisilvae]|uniref:alpha/beta fold hydrolase n=1 Tax=Catenulispora pinisilvae TaxID=2705253 RepID=UPI0018910588|nr:alpha/beta hydrolase [Catenulispora pinisilvae]
MSALPLPVIRHRSITVDGVRVFYRETGPERADAPTVLLLHGFPSSSHQFRRLLDALGTEHRLIAPDHPGFGRTTVPDGFVYSFESLTDVAESFVEALGLTADGRRLVAYTFDYGGPVAFRLAGRHPEWFAGLIVQNANAYAEGLSELAQTLLTAQPGVPGAEERVRGILTEAVTRSQYEDGTSDPELISPDGWTLDQHYLDLPGRDTAQIALMLDYHNNVELYPRWQSWLAERRPPTLILWGDGDAFFTVAGARAYLRDVPDAQLHVFQTGHFALEEKLPEMAQLIGEFLDSLKP